MSVDMTVPSLCFHYTRADMHEIIAYNERPPRILSIGGLGTDYRLLRCFQISLDLVITYAQAIIIPLCPFRAVERFVSHRAERVHKYLIPIKLSQGLRGRTWQFAYAQILAFLCIKMIQVNVVTWIGLSQLVVGAIQRCGEHACERQIWIRRWVGKA